MVRARAPGSGGDVPTRRLDDERQHAGRFSVVLVRQHGASSDIHARRTAIAGGADQCERDNLGPRNVYFTSRQPLGLGLSARDSCSSQVPP